MLTEAQRHQLYSELTEVLSTEGAAIIMDVVGSVTINELATKSDIAGVRAELKMDIAGVRAELVGVRSELKTDIAELRSELKTDIAELRSELKTDMAELKSDMAELKQDLTRTFATLLFVSQGVLVSIVGLLVTLT